MLKTWIELENGDTISSGASGTAVISFQLTEAVNSGEDLTLGSVCAAMAEVTLMAPEGCPIAQGERFAVYKVSDQGIKHKLGIFTAEKPQWSSANRVKITAYDNVTKLDKDLTSYLSALTDWPYTLQSLAAMVCKACGVTLGTEVLPNGSFPVKKFSAKGITGRQLLRWIGQATGCYCHADPEGKIRFGWYAPAEEISIGPRHIPGVDGKIEEENLTVTGHFSASYNGEDLTLSGEIIPIYGDDGNLQLTGPDRQCYYYQGSLHLAEYAVAPIEKVQLRQDSLDVGTVWPASAGEANTYMLEGNPLLTAQTAEDLLPVAKSLYERLKTVSYTPCTVTIPLDLRIKAGQILPLTDSSGRHTILYIMERLLTGTVMKLKCTGSANRQSTTVVNNTTFETLSGKVLRLQTDVEGIRMENADAAGQAASMALTVSGIESRVRAQKEELQQVNTEMSILRQEAQSLTLELIKVQENGASKVETTTGYTFSDEGLRICKSGMEMENRLDHTGMYVQRNGQTILQANNQGVVARDVTVDNYLIVGQHARFEDFGSGTACFYI